MNKIRPVHVIVDIGNTTVKAVVFRGDKIIRSSVIPEKNAKSSLLRICEEQEPSGIIISSVTKNTLSALLPTLRKRFTKTVITLDSRTPLPFKNKYMSPETLGNDRLANAAAANYMFPRENVLIIDAGTCLKYDFISGRQGYLGGGISPGITMRFRSLHTFTAKLPLYHPEKTKVLTGRNTKESIYSGAYLGMLAEMKQIIQQYREKYPDLKILLTGGDMGLFVKELKNGIFADRFLTVKGLNSILNYNV